MSARHVAVASLAAALAAMLSFWWVYRANTALRADLQAMTLQNPVPPIVNGFKLELRGARADAVLSTSADSAAASRTILFVSSDECTPCRNLLPKIKNLLSTLRLNQSDRVIVASYGGRGIAIELGSILRDRQVPFTVAEIGEQVVFSHATGVSSTPQILILDGDSRIRFSTNSLEPDVEQAFGNAWAELEAR